MNWLSILGLETLVSRWRANVIEAAIAAEDLIMLSLAVLVHFWDTPQRTLVAWIVAGVWVAGWAATLLSLVAVAKRASDGFALTRRELAQDWRDIKERL
ncbi:MAG: phage holin family protein [Acidovorax sp.]|nr:MAG: phage holin family protein [Acidovorax sp.]